jgi:hypothetical protein
MTLKHLRMWFNGRTPASQAGNAGSIPVVRSIRLGLERNALQAFSFSGLNISYREHCLFCSRNTAARAAAEHTLMLGGAFFSCDTLYPYMLSVKAARIHPLSRDNVPELEKYSQALSIYLKI